MERAASFSEAKPIEYILLDATPEAIQQRYYKKMQPWLSRQQEIAKELRDSIQTVEGKQVINTVNDSSDEIAKDIASGLLARSNDSWTS